MNASETTGTTVESILRAPWPLPLWATIVIAAALFAGSLWLYLAERGRGGRGLRRSVERRVGKECMSRCVVCH